MARAKRRYRVTVRYFLVEDEKVILQDLEEYKILAFDREDAEERITRQLENGNNPKVEMYDGWDCCISKI